MQQHTGQHLLSAIMDTYPKLETLGWGMGSAGTSNYVDLERMPTRDEILEIERKCNEVIRDNVPIEVQYPEGDGVAEANQADKHEKGVIRVIKIGDIDSNPYVPFSFGPRRSTCNVEKRLT
jgi:misacylated tRNA(Ala) deacylase